MQTVTQGWLDTWLTAPPLERLADALGRNESASVRGSRGSSATLLAAATALRLGHPLLYVVAHLDEADDALDDLERFASLGVQAERFGALEVLPGESSINLELLAERLAVVERIASGDLAGPCVLVAPITALMQSVPKPEALGQFTLTIATDDPLPPGRLLDWLDRAGFQREDAVAQPGDFAVRGGIVDLFPVGGSAQLPDGTPAPLTPVRLDFFGDDVESIHAIDPEAPGSKHKLGRVSLVGGSAIQVQTDADRTNLLDILPDQVVPILHETLELSEQARGYYERLTNPAGIDEPKAVFKKLTARTHAEVNGYSSGSAIGTQIDLPVEPIPTFDRDAEQAITELGELAADESKRVVVLCGSEGEQSRMHELIEQFAPEAIEKIEVELGAIHRGFALPGDPTLTLVPHHELFHRFETRRRVRKVFGQTSTGGDAFFDLDVGDYVVHLDHGIAKFTGLKTISPSKASKQTQPGEYLTLMFAEGALLHVPASQIDLVQKYVGGFEGRPPLSRLGGKKWKRQKEQVGDAVKDLAKELLQVQAARQTQEGIRYPGDTKWMAEFEAEFPYEETEDQLAAIASVKRDMSEPQPMDRLICGDVGFGKTEVAIRAAFKAVEFGKQVAVLVPTTVLAEQHERSFAARFADYPFRVESLSRFKTAKEARKVLQETAAGRVDVLIGTHRLLSQDVHFKDLGLVVIDEEQRFGVEHKNKLLAFRLTADVLTLSATPIPRTLHMSMVGL
ncbi:MAG: DEAD/DEAH box helicase, partial [Planctomycetota bacterium]